MPGLHSKSLDELDAEVPADLNHAMFLWLEYVSHPDYREKRGPTYDDLKGHSFAARTIFAKLLDRELVKLAKIETLCLRFNNPAVVTSTHKLASDVLKIVREGNDG